MDKSFKQKTGRKQKLKTPKTGLRFIKERDDLEGRESEETDESIQRWAAQVIAESTEKTLEVKATKIVPALSALILTACSILIFALTDRLNVTGLIFSGIGVLFLFLSAMFISLVFRARPLYEIDERGIRDHGLLSLGFGLIEWRNIESARVFHEKGSSSLLIKVDNYNELLERRNLLLRPYLWMSGMLCAILGGQINLPITLGNASQSTIMERISHFSRNSGRDVAAPKYGVLKDVATRVTLVLFFIVVFSFIAMFGFELYKQWQPHMNPRLETLGASFPREIPVDKRSAWLDDVIVQNFGGDSRGIKIELSGSSFDAGLLKQPKVLIQYDEKPEDLQHVRLRTRELVTLKEERKNFWTATSTTANMPHKDDSFMDTVKFFAPNGKSMLKQDIGFWTDTTSPNLSVEIFADTVKSGSGSVTLTVIPLANPSKVVSQTLQIRNDKISNYDMPLYSVSAPKFYPISLYPGGQIMWLSGSSLKFDSDAQPEQIATHYEKELNQKGWKTSLKEEKSSLELHATKGGDYINIRAYRQPGHSPVEISHSL